MAENPVEASTNLFDSSVYNSALLYCPSESIGLYRQTSPWSKFKNINSEGTGGGTISIAPDQASYTLTVGEAATMGYTLIVSGNATVKSKAWSSTNEAIAIVDDGLVKAVGAGRASVRLTVTDNYGKTYQNDWDIIVTGSSGSSDPEDEETPSTNLKYTEISDSEVAVIGYEGNALEAVVIPNQVKSRSTGKTFDVTEIRESAFAGSPYVRSVTIPENIRTIAPGSFYGCQNLEKVNYLSIKVTNDNSHHASPIFGNCPKFTSLNIGSSVIFLPKFIFMTTKITSVTIPDNVTFIGNDCFAYCDNLSEITIGKGVETIEWTAFRDGATTPLETTLWFNATNLEKYYGSQGNESVSATWPPMLKRNVAKIYFGADVNSTCPNLLHDCKPSDIYCESSVPPSLTGKSLYSTDKQQCRLHVPKNSAAAYRAANIWGDFYNIIEDFNPSDPSDPDLGGVPASVDLGLSVNWSEYNYGTTKAAQYGGLYGWGAPASKSLSDQTYPEQDNIGGTEYDIIAQKWGHGYRMPTRTELRELATKCTWTSEIVDGVNGFRVTGPNGNSIFIPASGVMHYPDVVEEGVRAYIWSSDQLGSDCGTALHIWAENNIFINFTYKFDGISLRGVTTETVVGNNPDSGIDNICNDESATVEVYNLNGIKVYEGLRSEMSLARGIYIVRSGVKVEKIAIK